MGRRRRSSKLGRAKPSVLCLFIEYLPTIFIRLVFTPDRLVDYMFVWFTKMSPSMNI